ncbi:MAG: LysE family translocator [Rhodospirillaceae bacterium]
MNTDLYLAFVLATVVLIVIPGPNVLLIVSQSLRFGRGAGLMAVAGTGFAQAQQLLVVGLGLSSFISFMVDWFEVLRWLGVAYLLFLGVQALRQPITDEAAEARAKTSANRRFWQAAFVSWTNPKVLAF